MEDGTPDTNMEAFPQTRKDVERDTRDYSTGIPRNEDISCAPILEMGNTYMQGNRILPQKCGHLP